MQYTLAKDIVIEGVGLHSGKPVRMLVRPAAADHGVVFVRSDLAVQDNTIPARWDYVTDTRLCTVIGNEAGASVGTVEHLMSALRGCGVDNALIELNGPEVPVMDGSAMPFVAAIEHTGLTAQAAPRRAIRILKPVTVEEGGKRVTLKPAQGSVFSGDISFDHPEIGTQRYETTLLNGNFKHDIAEARTFGFLHEVEYMRSQGLALGGSLDNAIVLDKTGVMNPDGLRFADEFIRHKILDAIGDLYLAGAPIIGAYDGSKAGHAMNNAILRALFAAPDAWEYVTVEDAPVESGFRFMQSDSAPGSVIL